MDLPIDKQEFDYIVTALWKCRKSEDKCGDLYDKMKLVQEVMDANPLSSNLKFMLSTM